MDKSILFQVAGKFSGIVGFMIDKTWGKCKIVVDLDKVKAPEQRDNIEAELRKAFKEEIKVVFNLV
jgi:hypothetical protein